MKLFEKKTKNENPSEPGHLKERNHFDGKDMILLVVMLFIIYAVFTWIEFFAQEKMNALEASENAQSTQEIVQTGESSSLDD